MNDVHRQNVERKRKWGRDRSTDRAVIVLRFLNLQQRSKVQSSTSWSATGSRCRSKTIIMPEQLSTHGWSSERWLPGQRPLTIEVLPRNNETQVGL